jgi:hypothetical protein
MKASAFSIAAVLQSGYPHTELNVSLNVASATGARDCLCPPMTECNDARKRGNEMTDSSVEAHIRYLEDEVQKIEAQADKVEATIATLENEQKKHALRELVGRWRDEVKEHRKYLAVMKPK